MNYADIKQYDVANGPGIRISLFVSGCTHHCKGCFNEVAWDFSYGKPFTKNEEEMILKYLEPSYIAGLTILGGEPFELVNQTGVLSLVKRVREEYPDKTIWCYSGYDYEKDILQKMVPNHNVTRELLSNVDVLVDGKFVLELKDLSLRFRGSSNQRIIDLRRSNETNSVVLWNDNRL